jgi:hypothetical protein
MTLYVLHRFRNPDEILSNIKHIKLIRDRAVTTLKLSQRLSKITEPPSENKEFYTLYYDTGRHN